MAHAAELSFFETQRGVKLHERRAPIKGKRPKALLVLCHGYGHHIEYVYFMRLSGFWLALTPLWQCLSSPRPARTVL